MLNAIFGIIALVFGLYVYSMFMFAIIDAARNFIIRWKREL